MGYIEDMKAAIEKQIEKEDEFSPVRGCAMQLTDIVGNNERLAQLVCEDFSNDRTVKGCEKKIKAFADKHKKGNCCYVPPNIVEGIIREYFGLGSASEQPTAAAPTTVSAPKPKVISFADMLAGLE